MSPSPPSYIIIAPNTRLKRVLAFPNYTLLTLGNISAISVGTSGEPPSETLFAASLPVASQQDQPSILSRENLLISEYPDRISTCRWFPDGYVPCNRREQETDADDKEKGNPYLLGLPPLPYSYTDAHRRASSGDPLRMLSHYSLSLSFMMASLLS